MWTNLQTLWGSPPFDVTHLKCLFRCIHPWNLTWNLKMMVWKIIFLSKLNGWLVGSMLIFRGVFVLRDFRVKKNFFVASRRFFDKHLPFSKTPQDPILRWSWPFKNKKNVDSRRDWWRISKRKGVFYPAIKYSGDMVKLWVKHLVVGCWGFFKYRRLSVLSAWVATFWFCELLPQKRRLLGMYTIHITKTACGECGEKKTDNHGMDGQGHWDL